MFHLYWNFNIIIWLVHGKPHTPTPRNKWKSAPVVLHFQFELQRSYRKLFSVICRLWHRLKWEGAQGSLDILLYGVDLRICRAQEPVAFSHGDTIPRLLAADIISSMPHFSSSTGNVRASTHCASGDTCCIDFQWVKIVHVCLGNREIL